MTSETVITLRLIRDFGSRNMRFLVLRDVDTSINVNAFFHLVRGEIESRSQSTAPNVLSKPFRHFTFDAMKIEHQAFGSKTNDPLIRLDNDQEVLNEEENTKTLSECGIQHETEVSVFKLDDYIAYKKEAGNVKE